MAVLPKSIDVTVSLPSVRHMVIVAGGKGTRLAPVAGNLPKALVSVGGKPVLHHQLELAASAGISDVTIFAGHLAEKVRDYVSDGSRFGLDVRTVAETSPLGDAGALLQSLDTLPDHFIVLYGDLMLAVNLQQIASHHLLRRADFTAMVHPNDHPNDSDLFEIDADGWVTAIHTSPHPPNRFFSNLVNAALYVVRREALRPWAGARGRQSFTKNIIPQLLAAGGRILAYRSNEYLRDMGTPSRLQNVESDWRSGSIRLQQSSKKHPAVFLDRDGTLNVEKGYLRTADNFELLPGVGAALQSLRRAGYRLVVLTNQPVIARGEATEADVAAIHRRLEWELGKHGAYLDGIYVCPHHPDGGFPGERADLKVRCTCRKPGTALFERACYDLHLDPKSSWMVGDRATDIEMADRAGLRSVMVRTGAVGEVPQGHAPHYLAVDLADAAEAILGQDSRVR